MPFDEQDNPFLADADNFQSEPRGFAPDQMVRCEACLRVNPPTRTSCLYCAAQLPTTEASAALRRPTLRKLEKWEQGFNVILLPGASSQLTDEARTETAQFLRLKDEEWGRILGAAVPLPVACAGTRDEASLIERKLNEAGVQALLVADAEMGLNNLTQRRVNALGMTDKALGAYSSGDGRALTVPWDEITLMVEGRLFQREVEVEERKGRGSDNELVDAREMSTDEAVLDIYAEKVEGCLRLTSRNFDFSCLGPRKSLIASQNFQTLAGVLRERAARAVYDDSYNRLRPVLSIAWPLEQETEARGWRRMRLGRVSTEAVTRSGNELQFTRYSRLRHYLNQRQPEAGG